TSKFSTNGDLPQAGRLRWPGGTRCFWVQTLQIREKVTYTSQVYKDRDSWKVQFVGNQKEANENFTIHLIAEGTVSEVWSHVIPFEGSEGTSGTPDKPGQTDKGRPCGFHGFQVRSHHPEGMHRSTSMME
uniref:Uncharacterized protein n=1 Tax=Moschus moschiferus TaxID=68415 RepID=A0A8C6D7W2_MOSMO